MDLSRIPHRILSIEECTNVISVVHFTHEHTHTHKHAKKSLIESAERIMEKMRLKISNRCIEMSIKAEALNKIQKIYVCLEKICIYKI